MNDWSSLIAFASFTAPRSSRQWLVLTLFVSGVFLGLASARAEDAAIDYEKEIKPLLKAHCYACHGSLKQEGGLRLDTAEFLKTGGDSGPAIEPGEEAKKSLLIERVAEQDISVRMPPEHEGEPFDAHEIDLLQRWIAAGAISPKDELPEASVRDHWSFRPVERQPLPVVQNAAWVRNPIDAWIAAGHEGQSLTPQPEASRIVLVRRLYLDLIGLPPTAEELAAAEADVSDDWYEKIVDRLLADPRYGQRWARHWMDVWRYSDWWGLNDQLRNSQRHMWHWRDWIVDSLNEDQSYDEMVRLMLAADELAPGDPDKLRATGYLARNYYIFNRDRWMDDAVTHVGKGFLGLTLNCAKCHDHKFDPIPQADFYRMRAFFEPYHIRVDMVPGTTNLTEDGIPRAFDGAAEQPTYLYVRGNEAQPDKSAPIPPGVPEFFAEGDLAIQPIALPKSAWQPGVRSWVLENHLAQAKRRQQAAQAKRDQAAGQLKPAESSPPPQETEFAAIIDSFATLSADRWKASGDGWTHSEGKLEQKLDGPTRSEITLLEPIPQDFEAEVRFKLVGGSKYRSVGLDFDVANPQGEMGGNAPGTFPYVYLSGWVQDSKIQGAFSRNGTSHYPGDGRQPYTVELDREYVLNVRVRGDLVNVSVNGEPVLAWKSPLPRRPGALRLKTFDALAEFYEFKLSALDPATMMTPPHSVPAANARQAYELAEAELNVANAELAAVELRIAAIQSQQQNASAENVEQTRVAAIRGEQRHAVASAERDVLAAEQALAKTSGDNIPPAKKKLAAAQKSLHEKLASLDAPIAADAQFATFSGAEWSATRFAHTGRDDPAITFPQTSTGRRTALANWITDPQNPLTARVAVNHLWSRHFGKPLAAAPFDFGRNSPTPTYPGLIDWLAAEFMDHDWSMKHIHRLIVTSSAYRMSSSLTGAAENQQQDPDNLFLWRRQPIRLESQLVRDSILALADTLDAKFGGPSVPPAEQADSHRRSLYFFHSNNDRNLFLSTFDEAEVTECYRREESVVPQQALAMTNSKLVLESAPQIAAKISQATADDDEFIESAFALLLGMYPKPEEIDASRTALTAWNDLPDGAAEKARVQLIWVLLNHNDFVTIR